MQLVSFLIVRVIILMLKMNHFAAFSMSKNFRFFSRSKIRRSQVSVSSSIVFSGSVTVSEAYEEGMDWLKKREIEDSEESSRYFLCSLPEVNSYRRSEFLKSKHRVLSQDSLNSFNKMLQERSTFKPIQYIIGNWDFCGETFLCKEPVLIPRPETEELVEKIIREVCKGDKEENKLSVLDIGSGSGCIGVTLGLRLNASVTCIDINPAATDLTLVNAKRLLSNNQLNKFRCFNVDFESMLLQHPELLHAFDIVVSNPPYIPSCELPSLQKEVRLFEDRTALDGGEDGLRLALKIMEVAPKLIKLKSRYRSLWMELSREHPERLQTLNSSSISVTAINDFTDFPRFVKVIYK
jgi:release factor glutamine methyltransferase